MLTIERIATIAREQTRESPEEIRALVERVLTQWRKGNVRSANLCQYIDSEIDALPALLQLMAVSVRNTITLFLSGEAVSAAEEHAGHRRTAKEIYQELNNGFALVERQGRGVVYFGSARTEEGNPFYECARELGRETARLLGSTSWSGAGPGEMQAALEGAREENGPIAGVKIRLERHQAAHEQKISHVFEGMDDVVICDHFDPRVTSLTDAGWPEIDRQERGAFIFLPGALGTMHELFVISVIKQLRKVGSNKVQDVPILIMNYNGFYDHLLQQLDACQAHGMVEREELQRLFFVATTNRQALDFLADHYHIPESERHYRLGTLLPEIGFSDGEGI